MTIDITVDIPMPAVNVAAHVAALGAVSALPDASVVWPHAVALEGVPAIELRAHASYQAGMALSFELVPLSDHAERVLQESEDVLNQAVLDCVQAWAAALTKVTGIAAPLAPVMDAYFEKLLWAGETVSVLYPNGNVCAQGTFAGLDVFGRAIVVDATGKETSYSPEQVSLKDF